MSGPRHGALSLGPASYTGRQFLFCYIRVVSQPILGRASSSLPRWKTHTILRRNKFAFQPTSLVLERAAASVHLRRKSRREKRVEKERERETSSRAVAIASLGAVENPGEISYIWGSRRLSSHHMIIFRISHCVVIIKNIFTSYDLNRAINLTSSMM